MAENITRTNKTRKYKEIVQFKLYIIFGWKQIYIPSTSIQATYRFDQSIPLGMFARNEVIDDFDRGVFLIQVKDLP